MHTYDILLGTSPDGSTVSALDQKDIVQVEADLISPDLRAELADMHRQIGSPHTWIQEERTIEEIANQLHDFCFQRLEPAIRRYTLSELITQAATNEEKRANLSRKITTLDKLASPYWQPVGTINSKLEFRKVASVSRPEPFAEWLKQLQGSYEVMPVASEHELVLLATRFGFLLEEMRSYSQQLEPAYRATHQWGPAGGYGTTQTANEFLYTAEERFIWTDANKGTLLDLRQEDEKGQPLMVNVPQLFALGLALNGIYYKPDNGGAFYYTTFAP